MFFFTINREKSKHFSNRDYVFYSKRDNQFDSNDDIFSHIVNVNFFCIHVRNITDSSVFIFRQNRLKTLQKYENESCYLASSKNAHLAVDEWFTRTTKLIVRILLIALIKDKKVIKKVEIALFNKMTFYENIKTTSLLKDVVEKYSTLWKNDERIIDISKKRWMSIKLKSKVKVSLAKVYSLKSKKKKL